MQTQLSRVGWRLNNYIISSWSLLDKLWNKQNNWMEFSTTRYFAQANDYHLLCFFRLSLNCSFPQTTRCSGAVLAQTFILYGRYCKIILWSLTQNLHSYHVLTLKMPISLYVCQKIAGQDDLYSELTFNTGLTVYHFNVLEQINACSIDVHILCHTLRQESYLRPFQILHYCGDGFREWPLIRQNRHCSVGLCYKLIWWRHKKGLV